MDYKLLVLLICSYILAFSINMMPALKHPDLNLNVFNLFVSIILLIVLLIYTRKGNNKLKVFSIIGVISGVLIFTIKTFENSMFDHTFWDTIASIQYPFYLIFTTPLFGLNILFDLNYATYSLLLSLFYFLVFILAVNTKKNDSQNV